MTPSQRNALHLYLDRLAERMEDGGFDMKKILDAKPIDVPPTRPLLKETIVKPIIKAMFDKTSTEELTTTELNRAYEVMNRWTSENFHISVPFPSEE